MIRHSRSRFHPLRSRVNHSSCRSKSVRLEIPAPQPASGTQHPHLHTDFTVVTSPRRNGRPNIYEDVTVILISGLELISVPFFRPSEGGSKCEYKRVHASPTRTLPRSRCCFNIGVASDPRRSNTSGDVFQTNLSRNDSSFLS